MWERARLTDVDENDGDEEYCDDDDAGYKRESGLTEQAGLTIA